MQLPDDSVRKGLAKPWRIPAYLLRESSLKPWSRMKSGLLSTKYESQASKLAELRTKENFCLIILDACRYDLLNERFSAFFKGECAPIWAEGLNTFEYVRKLWTENYEYPYVTAAAPITSQQFNFEEGENVRGVAGDGASLLERYCGYIPNNHFNNLIEVWRDQWDEKLGVCPPEPVTESAIRVTEQQTSDRIVVHYFQPHGPFIGEERFTGSIEGYDTDVTGGAIEKGIWSAVRDGEISDKKLRDLYRDNLDRALCAVTELIKKTDYKNYIIMGDHGEALGEYGQYYHSIEHPKVRIVPWAIIDGIKDDSPEIWDYSPSKTNLDKSTTSRLKELGYID